jgi:phosphatidylserine/phosphatidylglycerophosphate/cardiolipin synthase-like enzyme
MLSQRLGSRDEAVVITGSFNFTKAAEEHHAENMLVIHDVPLACAV